MTKAQILKKEILSQYKSVRQFAIEMSIPYSTLVIRMCDRLNLNPVDFSPLERGQDLGNSIVENRVMKQYIKLNKPGRKKILDIMTDFSELEKYQA